MPASQDHAEASTPDLRLFTLGQLADEIGNPAAGLLDTLTGAGNVLAWIVEPLLDKAGIGHPGKATLRVEDEDDGEVRVTLAWKTP